MACTVVFFVMAVFPMIVFLGRSDCGPGGIAHVGRFLSLGAAHPLEDSHRALFQKVAKMP